MKKILTQKFFNRGAKIVAEELLGKFLVRKIGKKEIALIITETEAYDGPHDKASHAHNGSTGSPQGRRTARTEVMFGPAGYLYIYLCYGMHYMLNVVVGPKDYPAAVLIRAVVPTSLIEGRPTSLTLNGPGKLTKFLKIDKKLNGFPAVSSVELHCSEPVELWFEDRGVKIKKSDIKKTPRIGVSYAGPVWSRKKMRFVLDLKGM